MYTNDINYSRYKSHRTYLTNHMGSISHHIMPIVINSFGTRIHTHTHTHTYACTHTHRGTCMHTDACTKALLRNQANAILWLTRAWFKITYQ